MNKKGRFKKKWKIREGSKGGGKKKLPIKSGAKVLDKSIHVICNISIKMKQKGLQD